MDLESISRVLGEIGLSDVESDFVSLATRNYSMEQIIEEMGVSRSRLYSIKASIRDKILAWGQG
jgi:hypothetical protein